MSQNPGVGAGSSNIISTKTPLAGSSPATASVGVASGQVLASNASRKGFVFVNLSANNISFGVGTSAVSGSGITLTPNGVWVSDEYNFTTSAINAIATGASSSLSIQEFI